MSETTDFAAMRGIDYSDEGALDTLERNFTYHPPQPSQPARYTHLREEAKEFAKLLVRMCPPSRERSVALTNLETCVLWANASIARNEIVEVSDAPA